MNSRSILLGLVGLLVLLVVLAAMALRPVPLPIAANCVAVTGRVAAVDSPCCEDVVIRLEGDGRTFYINRGLERGLRLETLRDRIVGKEVEIQMIRRSWSPLDPMHRLSPVARVSVEGDRVFDGMENE